MTQPWGPPNAPQWPTQQWPPPQPAWPPTQGYPVPPNPGYPPPAPAPFAPGGYPPPGQFLPPPQRPRRGPALAVLAGLGFVVLLALFVITIANFLAGGSSDQSTTTGTHAGTTTAQGVPAPNDNAPELPAPATLAEATQWMKANPVYSQDVPIPTQCVVGYIDPAQASSSALERHLNELTACLWKVWSPPVTAAGFEMPRPPVTVYSSDITTPCGTADAGNAFYCAADQHIYYSKSLYKVLPSSLRNKPFVPDMVVAHEFGHAVQARTGILAAEKIREAKASSSSSAAEYSRRTEVQADCLSGLYLHAVSEASALGNGDLATLKKLAQALGDDSQGARGPGDHGTGASRRFWFTTGVENSQIGKCNSFSAPSSKVR